MRRLRNWIANVFWLPGFVLIAAGFIWLVIGGFVNAATGGILTFIGLPELEGRVNVWTVIFVGAAFALVAGLIRPKG